MRVTVNGEAEEIPEGLTVRGLIEWLKLTDGPVAVEKNGEVVPRNEHASAPIEPGDAFEIVHFVGGG